MIILCYNLDTIFLAADRPSALWFMRPSFGLAASDMGLNAPAMGPLTEVPTSICKTLV